MIVCAALQIVSRILPCRNQTTCGKLYSSCFSSNHVYVIVCCCEVKIDSYLLGATDMIWFATSIKGLRRRTNSFIHFYKFSPSFCVCFLGIRALKVVLHWSTCNGVLRLVIVNKFICRYVVGIVVGKGCRYVVGKGGRCGRQRKGSRVKVPAWSACGTTVTFTTHHRCVASCWRINSSVAGYIFSLRATLIQVESYYSTFRNNRSNSQPRHSSISRNAIFLGACVVLCESDPGARVSPGLLGSRCKSYHSRWHCTILAKVVQCYGTVIVKVVQCIGVFSDRCGSDR